MELGRAMSHFSIWGDERPLIDTDRVGRKEPTKPRGRSCHGRGADIEASKGRVASLAADLDGFELVESLDVLAVEVSLIAHDLGEGVGVGKETAADLPPDGVQGYCLGHRFAEGTFLVLGGEGHIVWDGLQVDLYHLRLVANSAVKPPDKGGYAFGEDGFEVAIGVEAVYDATAEGVPVGLTFESLNDGGRGADAVFGGVAADCGLSGWGVGAALGDGSPHKGCLG